MKRNFAPFVWLAAYLLYCTPSMAAEDWTPLFDGKSLSGWKVSEYPGSFHVDKGKIVCGGPRAHLYYVGDDGKADFMNFELKVDVKAAPGANSGIYFHTKYEPAGYPKQGFEVQINNTQPAHGRYYEFKKTGSLYGIRNQYMSIARDNEWSTMHVKVVGPRIRVWVDEKPVVDYTEPNWSADTARRPGRRLSRGTFALQCHDPRSKVLFRNILVRWLPDDATEPAPERPTVDERYAQILDLQRGNFPLIDLHVHLKGGLTLEQALTNSRKTGINYGIAPNCGLGFPIIDDAGIETFIEQMRGQPIFIGMQAEGREWVTLFSKEAIARFDYVFSDAMTFTDHKGRRTRLWIDEEVHIDDERAYMDMIVDRIVSVLSNEPIDIYVNATFLPKRMADHYDMLWTPERMQRVIDAAVGHDVAIEIGARYRIPSPAFIKRAKQAGAKFTFGTNNGGPELGRLEYCLDMIEECGLTSGDMFVPLRKSRTNATKTKIEKGPIIAPGAKVELLADGFKFTEGPACDADGNVLFTDQPNDRILQWGIDKKLTTFMQPAGRSNGLCFDAKGNLWACADDKNQLWCIGPDKKVDVVIEKFDGKLLNGPNDLWIAPSGAVYFTDPFYKRPYWDRGPIEQPGQCVYRLSADRKTRVRCVTGKGAEDLTQPNGIIGTPDGKTLYVADIGAKKTYAYRIARDGTLTDKRLFCEMGSDGMTIDDRGNVYLTGKGVTVFNPRGKQIEQIPVDARWTANVCFGGPDRKTLFITAGEGLFGLRMQVEGVGSQ